MRDFNSPLIDDDKCGGLATNYDSKLDLTNFIHNLAFMDMDLLGGSFTWSNRRVGVECIQVRLDRALISPGWLQPRSIYFPFSPEWAQTIPLFLFLLAPLLSKGLFLFTSRKCG